MLHLTIKPALGNKVRDGSGTYNFSLYDRDGFCLEGSGPTFWHAMAHAASAAASRFEAGLRAPRPYCPRCGCWHLASPGNCPQCGAAVRTD